MKQAIVSSMVKMRWENDINQRYYVAIVELDLLGDWMITRIWGRKATSRGQLIRRRKKRGYHLINQDECLEIL